MLFSLFYIQRDSPSMHTSLQSIKFVQFKITLYLNNYRITVCVCVQAFFSTHVYKCVFAYYICNPNFMG